MIFDYQAVEIPDKVWMEIDGKRISGFADDGQPVFELPRRVLTEKNAKQQGRHDRIIEKIRLNANPYIGGSVKWQWWRAAWLKADKEMRWLGDFVR